MLELYRFPKRIGRRIDYGSGNRLRLKKFVDLPPRFGDEGTPVTAHYELEVLKQPCWEVRKDRQN